MVNRNPQAPKLIVDSIFFTYLSSLQVITLWQYLENDVTVVLKKKKIKGQELIARLVHANTELLQ